MGTSKSQTQQQTLNEEEKKGIFQSFVSFLQNINLCLRPFTQSPQLSDFLAQYNDLTLYHDPYYGQCYALSSEFKENKCLLITKLPQGQHNQVVAQIQNIEEYNKDKNIVQIQIISDVTKRGFIWTTRSLYISADFIMADLEKEFEQRILEGKQFKESEIYIIMKECLKGLIRLQGTGYNSCRMRFIYLCNHGYDIKLAHPKLFKYSSNLQEVYDNTNEKGIYLSPEEMQELSRGHAETKLNDNVYSLGMIVLALMEMKHMDHLYDYAACQINFTQIQEILHNLKNNYSERLIGIVNSMLATRSEQRISLLKLQTKLNEKYQVDNSITVNLIREETQIAPIVSIPVYYEEKPHTVNYLAGLVYPKVGLRAEYFKEQEQQDYHSTLMQNLNENPVIANQRHFYENNNSRYIGDIAKKGFGENQKIIREGKGVYRYQQGEQLYVGEWKGNKMDGEGKLYWDDHTVRYQGSFKEGMFDGFGTEYSQGQMAEREEEIDHTFIRLHQGSWLKYEGHFVQDKRCGSGKAYYRKGHWVGNFRDNQPNGEGIFYYSNGKKHAGVWKNGYLKE